MIKSKELEKISSISHGFFGRQGGVSSGIYDSLNCGPGSNDDSDKVTENRDIVVRQLGAEKLCTLYQRHSDKVIVADESFEHGVEADAMVANVPGIAIGILTADCVPLLFADESAGIIGAAHAGWKGAKAGIVENTIESMVSLGAERKNIIAAIGPCICKDSYEVGMDFKKQFLEADINNRQFFYSADREDKAKFDLPGYVIKKLEGAGINNIDFLNVDTVGDDKSFFSYRRATIAGEGDYGRQVSVILLNRN